MKGVYIGLYCMFFFNMQLFSQRSLLKEDFEREYLSSLKITEANRSYQIETYSPKEKRPINICSFREDPPFDNSTIKGCCPDSLDKEHGFFAEIMLYEKGVPSMRDIIVVRLDTMLFKSESVNISLKVKYHPFASYSADSIQALFVKQDKDVFSWLAGKEVESLNVSFSLMKVSNKTWTQISANLHATDAYRYVIIGNLKTDEQTIVTKDNTCNCAKKEKAFWDYSSLFLDDIMVIEN